MKKILLTALLLTGIFVQAQKSLLDANAVKRNISHFRAIEIADGIDLYLTQGNEEALAVSASSADYRDKIRTEVVNDVLKIYYNREGGWNLNWGNRKLKAYVSVKQLEKLTASGGADVFIENGINAGNLTVHLSGGSDFRGKLTATKLSLSASGGSDIYISGSADDVTIDVSGGSDVHGFELVSNTCRVDCSGGSDVRITANKNITARASGGSDVYYKGNANSDISKSGGGSVKKLRD